MINRTKRIRLDEHSRGEIDHLFAVAVAALAEDFGPPAAATGVGEPVGEGVESDAFTVGFIDNGLLLGTCGIGVEDVGDEEVVCMFEEFGEGGWI